MIEILKTVRKMFPRQNKTKPKKKKKIKIIIIYLQ